MTQQNETGLKYTSTVLPTAEGRKKKTYTKNINVIKEATSILM
jgi:hypothetical protein